MPAWRSAPSAATAAPLVSALAEHRATLLEHLHDEEEYILPLIAEHLTAPEWARLGERFAEEVPKSKMLFFLGMILEDADPAEREAMMANLPAPARFAWKAFGQRQFRRRVSKIRAVLPGQVPVTRTGLGYPDRSRWTGQPGEHGRGLLPQPWRRSTLATSAAVWQGCHLTCDQPYRSDCFPSAAAALSLVLSRHWSSGWWASRPSSSMTTPKGSYTRSRRPRRPPGLVNGTCRADSGSPCARSTSL